MIVYPKSRKYERGESYKTDTYTFRKEMVEDFLIELHEILHNPKFHIDTDFIFICKKKASESEEYSTPYTMMELEFDTSDVLQVLDTLTIEDYSESLFDKDNDSVCVISLCPP